MPRQRVIPQSEVIKPVFLEGSPCGGVLAPGRDGEHIGCPGFGGQDVHRLAVGEPVILLHPPLDLQ